MTVKHLWSPKWRSANALDGEREYLISCAGLPLLFKSKAATQAYIKQKYGYIARRRDLKKEPHGWKMPVAVRVAIIESRT